MNLNIYLCMYINIYLFLYTYIPICILIVFIYKYIDIYLSMRQELNELTFVQLVGKRRSILTIQLSVANIINGVRTVDTTLLMRG